MSDLLGGCGGFGGDRGGLCCVGGECGDGVGGFDCGVGELG